MAADVVAAEYAITMLDPCHVIAFLLSIVEIVAKALTEAAHGTINDATMCFAQGYT